MPAVGTNVKRKDGIGKATGAHMFFKAIQGDGSSANVMHRRAA